MKKLLTVLLTVLMVFTLAACGGSNNETPKEDDTKDVITQIGNYTLVNPGYLTVSVSTDFAPYEFVDMTKSGQDKYVGSDISFAKFVADYLGLELMIKPMDFDIAQTAVNNNISDIAISGISYTDERAASYLFTDCYYATSDGGQVVVVAAKNKDVYKTLEDLNKADVKVAAQNGALQQGLVEEQLPNATMNKVDNLNDAYDALVKDAIQAVAVDSVVGQTLANSDPDKYAVVEEWFKWDTEGNYGMVKQGNTDLADSVNKAIASMEKGQYEKWIDEAEALFAQLGDNAVEDIVSEEE